MAKLHFFGGTEIVSGSCYMLESGTEKILVDCGLFQGTKDIEAKNSQPFDFDPRQIDSIIITHSHLDHIGRLPMLLKSGFRGKIFATPPTIEFTRLMLEDSRKVLAEKARHADAIPLFFEGDIDAIMKFFVPVEYHVVTPLSKNISFEFYEAGHILGSAFVVLKTKEGRKEKTIVFSGDLGNYSVSILRPLEIIKKADFVLIESAYGDRLHERGEAAKDIIEDTIEETIARGGTLMIPSFAMERAQQLIFHLNELAEHKRIPSVPVFIDSPLAIEVTNIYRKYTEYFNKEASDLIKKGDDIFKFAGLRFTSSVKESKEIDKIPPPKIIIAGSGMSQGGRIIHHELKYLGDPKNTLLMVTYQAEGTLGRQILKGAREVDILDTRVAVRAQIKSISSYSAHADQAGLLGWISNIKKPVKRIFVLQGEKDPALKLAIKIKDTLGIDAIVPKLKEVAELD